MTDEDQGRDEERSREAAEQVARATLELSEGVSEGLEAGVDPAMVLESAITSFRQVTNVYASKLDRDRLSTQAAYELAALLVNLQHHENALEAQRAQGMLMAGLMEGNIRPGGGFDIDLSQLLNQDPEEGEPDE